MNNYYTYLIGWPELNLWYYGVRTGNKIAPDKDFWHHYFTSSQYVKELRISYGEPSIREIRKEFSDKLKAKIWERQVLRKMKVVRNNKWINKSVPGAWDMTDEICQKISRAISNKRWITDDTNNQYININDNIPEGWHYGRSGVGGTTQWKQRLSEAQSKNKASMETRAKMSAAKIGEKNSFYGKTHCDSSISKMSNSHKENWAKKSTFNYITPWGKFISTPDAAKAAPYKISAGMIWMYCFKYSNNQITVNMKIAKCFPEYIGQKFKDIGFGIENI